MTVEMWISVVVLVVFTAVAAYLDLTTRRIPNWLTVPVFAAGIVFHLSTAGLTGLGLALGGFAVGFGTLLVLWLIGGGGGGDVKLMGAMGAWLGAPYTVILIILSTIVAALGSGLVLVFTLITGGYGKVKGRHFDRVRDKTRKGKRLTEEEKLKARTRRRLIPFALPVACGTWVILAWQIYKVYALAA